MNFRNRKRGPGFVAAMGVGLVAVGLLAAMGGCEPTAQQRELTILLLEYKGPEAVDSAYRLARELTEQNLPDVFVVEGPQYGAVCVGRYERLKDPAARKMLARVRGIRDARGQYPFVGVMLMPVPEPAPSSKWLLEEAPGVFTLHIASWEAPGRKDAAQEYARTLREKGYEAYVYHGPRLSMVTLGAFGLEIFDDPSKVGRPGRKPRIVGPTVLGLRKEFPRMRLEGQLAPMVKRKDGKEVPLVPTGLVRIPGRETPPTGGVVVPSALYRVSLQLVSTETGLAEGLGRAAGVAQARRELPVLVEALTKQLLGSIEGDKAARIGIAGIQATGRKAVETRADESVLQAVTAALSRAAPAARLTVLGPETTRQILDAAGLSVRRVLRDPRLVKGLREMDFVLVGSVTVVPT